MIVRIINDDDKTNVFENIYPVTCNYSINVDISDTSKYIDGKYSVELQATDKNDVTSNVIKQTFIIERSSPSFEREIIEKWAGKVFVDKLDLPVSVIKNGGLKEVRYSIKDLKNGNTLIENKILKFKESKTQGKYDVDSIKEDFSKMKQEGEKEFILGVRIEAEDFINNVTGLTIPVILDYTAPYIGDLEMDQKAGLMSDTTLDINDNIKLKSVVIELTSGKNSINKFDITPEVLNEGYTNGLIVNVSEPDAKSNNEYNLVVSAKDFTGMETKKSFRIFFTNTDSDSYKIGINVHKNENFSYLTDPMILLDGSDAGFESFDSTVYCLVPSTLQNFYLTLDSKKMEPVYIEGDTGVCYFTFSDEDKASINKLKIETAFFGINASNVQKKIAVYNFYNDRSYPKLDVLWPSGYMYFNNSITMYGKAWDDSDEIDVTYSIDSDGDFTGLKLVTQGDIKNDNVINLDPLKRSDKSSLLKYFEANNIKLAKDEKIFKIELPLLNMSSGEHYILIKARDKSGKEVVKKFVTIFDNTNPELSMWNPADEEIVNGEITVSGDAKDDFKLSNVLLLKNGKDVFADGNYFWNNAYNLNDLSDVDYTKKDIKEIKISATAYDFAGNKTTLTRNLKLDLSSDMPDIFINSPAVDEQRFTDLVEIGGVAIDDDGVKYVQYRIDAVTNGKTDDATNGVQWEKIEMEEGNPNWNKKIESSIFKSGPHVLEVQAIDLFGLKSRITKMTFHIDRENPVIEISSPSNGKYIKGETVITGKATDPNGIGSVEISTNYGWTYVKTATSPTELPSTNKWQYSLNTLSVPDGALRVLIKTKDKAGSDAFSFVLYNVDNKSPVLEIFTPKEAGKLNNVFKVEGRAKDNIDISWIKAAVTVFDDKSKNLEDQFFNIDINNHGSWSFNVDTAKFDITKRYQIIVRASDPAGNITEKSVSFYVDPASDVPTVQLDQPQAEQHVTGSTIDFYGTAYDDDGLEYVSLKIDDGEEIKVDGTTAWHYSLPAFELKPGTHKVTIIAREVTGPNSTGKTSTPLVRSFYYDESGPVIEITSHKNGEPMEHRPYLMGNVYFYENDIVMKLKKEIREKKLAEMTAKLAKTPENIPELDQIPVSVSEYESLKRKHMSENAVKSLYLSLDNGKTFEKVPVYSSTWRIRVQTQKLKDGVHVLQLKSITKSDKESIRYFKVILDRNKPVVILDSPVENERLNEKIEAGGIVTDNEEVEKVKISLRQYDKNFSKVPKFIQGLYLWAQFLGGPTVSGGFGFTFFDDVVRLEGLFGWTATRANFYASGQDPNNVSAFFRQSMDNPRYQPRFSGFATGGKLLAKILDIPYGYFFGEDAQNFSQSIEIGCAFYWFSGYGGTSFETDNSFYLAEKGREYDPKLDGKLVAGFLYQIDLFKVERYGPFRKFAIYFENAFFFIASEMEGGLFPQFGFGIRNSFF